MARETYEAFARGDYGPLLERLHPDVVWRAYMAGASEPAVYYGPDGVVEFSDDWNEVWESLDVEVDEVIRLEEHRLLILLRWRATAGGSGAEIEQRAGHIIRFDEELRVLEMDGYMRAEDALAAAQAAGTGSAGSSIGPGISSSGGGMSSPITPMRRFSAR
jgi:ketosteroid isomerase-like protein